MVEPVGGYSPVPDASGDGRGAFETEWRDRFREFAEERDDDAGIAGWTPTGLEARLRRFRQLWRPTGDFGRWLDAGCGAGSYTRILRSRGREVVGIDYSLLALQKALQRSDPAVAYAAADVRRLPFCARTFDGALCFGVMQALTDAAPAIRELVQVVKPGGEIWIDALNRWCLVHVLATIRRRLRGRPRHLRYDSPAAIRKAMWASGIQDVSLHWMPIVPRRWHRIQPLVESAAAQFMFGHVPLLGLIFCHAFIVRGHAARAPR